jgi:hypothetical protein
MSISTARQVARAQTTRRPVTVALGTQAARGLILLEERTGLSQGDVTACALTWYAYLDAQLRAGYCLTLWNDQAGKAYTISLTTGAATTLGTRWHPTSFTADGPAHTEDRPWLAGTSSRGSPAGESPARGHRPPCRHNNPNKRAPGWQSSRGTEGAQS